ncbi:MAG: hypothetical protein GX638_14175 [Crenarchaeota archaeon]|nr:hypothetical protein [Thermoproteota archaeon]
MGKNQGMRCEKCKTKFTNLSRIEKNINRDIQTGLYITSTRSQRHLTKPFRRYGLEKNSPKLMELITDWHSKST